MRSSAFHDTDNRRSDLTEKFLEGRPYEIVKEVYERLPLFIAFLEDITELNESMSILELAAATLQAASDAETSAASASSSATAATNAKNAAEAARDLAVAAATTATAAAEDLLSASTDAVNAANSAALSVTAASNSATAALAAKSAAESSAAQAGVSASAASGSAASVAASASAASSSATTAQSAAATATLKAQIAQDAATAASSSSLTAQSAASTASGAAATVSAAVATEAAARVAGDAAEATAREALAVSLSDEIDTKVGAAVTTEAAARTTAIAAEASARSSLATTLSNQITSGDNTVRGELNAAISTEQLARSTAISAEASARSSLATTLRGETDTKVAAEAAARTTAINAAITTEQSARSTAIAAEASARNSLATTLRAETDTKVADEAAARETAINAAVANEASARSTAIGAEASARTSLAASLRQESDARSAGNLLANTDFAVGYDGWTIGGGSGALPDGFGANYPGSSWVVNYENNLGVRQSGRVGNGAAHIAASQGFPVKAGEYYQISTYIAAHRAQVQVQLIFMDEAGNVLTEYNTGAVTPLTGGKDPANYSRIGVLAQQAPANATRGLFVAYKLDTALGQTDSYMWIWRPQACIARAGANQFSAYTPGSARSGLAQVSAAIVAEQTARANGDAAEASARATLQTTVNGNTASISSLQSSLNGTRARYTLTLNVNGHITGFEQESTGGFGSFIITADRFAVVAPGGGTPVIPFEVSGGSVKINGNLIVNGTITFNGLAAGSASLSSAYSLGDVLNLSTSWQEVAAVSLSTLGSTQAKIDFSVRVTGAAMYSSLPVQYRIKRNGTVIRTGMLEVLQARQVITDIVSSMEYEFSLPIDRAVSLFHLDLSVPSGTTTYSVEVMGESLVSVSERQMVVTELRR